MRVCGVFEGDAVTPLVAWLVAHRVLASCAVPAAILAPEGVMVVGSCRWARPADAEPFWAEVQEDYRAVGLPGGAASSPGADRQVALPR